MKNERLPIEINKYNKERKERKEERQCWNDGGMFIHKYHTEYILNEGIDGRIYRSPVLVIDD